MTLTAAHCQLLGTDSDETRLLAIPSLGYSVPLAGYPVLVEASLVRLRDVNVEYSFHFDDAPRAKVIDAVPALASTRARADWDVEASPISTALRPASSTGGAHVTYPLRDTGDLVAEELWAIVNATNIIYRTTRYRPAEFATIKWHHVRTASGAHHHWDAAAPRTTTPTIWPTSALALPGMKLELTDAALEEGRAKIRDIGSLTLDEARALIDLLNHAALNDFAPSTVMPEILVDLYPPQLRQFGHIGTVLGRNLHQCKTAFDYRAWAWQCAWALGNCKTH